MNATKITRRTSKQQRHATNRPRQRSLQPVVTPATCAVCRCHAACVAFGEQRGRNVVKPRPPPQCTGPASLHHGMRASNHGEGEYRSYIQPPTHRQRRVPNAPAAAATSPATVNEETHNPVPQRRTIKFEERRKRSTTQRRRSKHSVECLITVPAGAR